MTNVTKSRRRRVTVTSSHPFSRNLNKGPVFRNGFFCSIKRCRGGFRDGETSPEGDADGQPIKGTGLLKKSGRRRSSPGTNLIFSVCMTNKQSASSKIEEPGASGSAPSRSDTPESALSNGRDTWRAPIHDFALPRQKGPLPSTSARRASCRTRVLPSGLEPGQIDLGQDYAAQTSGEELLCGSWPDSLKLGDSCGSLPMNSYTVCSFRSAPNSNAGISPRDNETDPLLVHTPVPVPYRSFCHCSDERVGCRYRSLASVMPR